MGPIAELNADSVRSRPGSVSDQIVVIRDNSIIVIFVLSTLMVLAVLALIRVLLEDGRLHAHTMQPQVIIHQIKTKQKLKTSPPPASVKIEAPPAVAIATGQTERAMAPLTVATGIPSPPQEKKALLIPETPKAKTAPVAMPSAALQAMAASQPSVILAKASTGVGIVLTTMRGGRRPEYASIVFQFSGKITYDTPRIKDCAIKFRLSDTASRLPSFRRYKTFDSWVLLERNGPDLDIAIGLLPGLIKFSAFLMENPSRLVINLYDGEAFR